MEYLWRMRVCNDHQGQFAGQPGWWEVTNFQAQCSLPNCHHWSRWAWYPQPATPAAGEDG
jgi:hypothetical protein